MNEYITALKNYAVFNGKATRKDYWMFVLVNIIISFLISFLGVDLLSSLYSLLLIIPSLAVGARRLHDINRTGWWQLLYLIPIIGWIVLLIFFIQPSKGAPVASAPTDSTPTGTPSENPESSESSESTPEQM